MHMVYSVVVELMELIEDLNRRSVDTPISPRSDFSISIHSPDSDGPSGPEVAGTKVRIEITYESGGSEESSYIIQDTIEFRLSSTGAHGVVCEEEGLQTPLQDISAAGVSSGELLQLVTAFCEKRLPNDDFLLPP